MFTEPPIKFTVGLWMESENVAGIFNDFLQAGASVLEILLCRQKCSYMAFASQQTLRVGDTPDFGANLDCLFGIEDQGVMGRTQ